MREVLVYTIRQSVRYPRRRGGRCRRLCFCVRAWRRPMELAPRQQFPSRSLGPRV